MTPKVGTYYLTKNDSVVYIFCYEEPCPFTGTQSKHPYRGYRLVVGVDYKQRSLRYQWTTDGRMADHHAEHGLDLKREVEAPSDPLNWYQFTTNEVKHLR